MANFTNSASQDYLATFIDQSVECSVLNMRDQLGSPALGVSIEYAQGDTPGTITMFDASDPSSIVGTY